MNGNIIRAFYRSRRLLNLFKQELKQKCNGAEGILMLKKITIKEIAEDCGVSLATTSRVLSGSDYPVNAATREKIMNSAKKLGYVPNSYARSLRAGSNEIAVVIPTLSNPFYTSLVSGFEAAVSAEKRSLVLYAGSSRESVIESIAGRGPKGVLVAAPDMYEDFEKNASMFKDTKIILADCPSPQKKFSSVCFDYKKGTFMGTDYLIKSGHRDIMYIGMPIDRDSRQFRIDGFNQALLTAGINCEGRVVSAENYKGDESLIDAGEHLAASIFSRGLRPTAIAAMNDMMAFGVLRYLSRSHIQVPEEVSVIGFDDNIFCDAANPPLTTIKVPDVQMGKMAGMLMLNEAGSETVNLFVEPLLIERDSVGKLL